MSGNGKRHWKQRLIYTKRLDFVQTVLRVVDKESVSGSDRASSDFFKWVGNGIEREFFVNKNRHRIDTWSETRSLSTKNLLCSVCISSSQCRRN